MQCAALNVRSAHVTTVDHESFGECKTLVGRYPEYFEKLYFSTEETAKRAKKEANWVLKNGEVPESEFTRAYVDSDGNSVLV